MINWYIFVIDNEACWDGKNSSHYRGHVSVSEKGHMCQTWSSKKPHVHQYYNDDASFPLDGGVAGASNYCRDPDGRGRTWCYTMNPTVRWDYCVPPVCSGESNICLAKASCACFFLIEKRHKCIK